MDRQELETSLGCEYDTVSQETKEQQQDMRAGRELWRDHKVASSPHSCSANAGAEAMVKLRGPAI